MAQSTASARDRTVVPQAIRKRMGIKPGAMLEWQIVNGQIVVMPLPHDPVRASVGLLRGKGLTTDDLLAERQMERRRHEHEQN